MGDRPDLAPFAYLEKLEGVREGVREIKSRKFRYFTPETCQRGRSVGKYWSGAGWGRGAQL